METTRDSISLRGAGIIRFEQIKNGNRLTFDSILLADFCRIKPRDRILEPCAGTGVISLLLSKKFPSCTLVAVELDPLAAKLSSLNFCLNGVQDRVASLHQDIRTLNLTGKIGSFDAIVSNPPYSKYTSGKQSPLLRRRIGRHDHSAPLASVLDLHPLLKNRGRFVLVFPASRAAELFAALRLRNLEPKRARFIHSFSNKPASLVLVEAVKSAATGLQIMPPLIVHQVGGAYSDEMKALYDV